MVNYLDRITWNDVDWTFSVHKVRTLQSRIFKASQNNDRQKAHWLQFDALYLQRFHLPDLPIFSCILQRAVLGCPRPHDESPRQRVV